MLILNIYKDIIIEIKQGFLVRLDKHLQRQNFNYNIDLVLRFVEI